MQGEINVTRDQFLTNGTRSKLYCLRKTAQTASENTGLSREN